MHSVIKEVFSIIGSLFLASILYFMIFSNTGQQFLWRAIEPQLENHWRLCTMNNGVDRSVVYEEQFEKLK